METLRKLILLSVISMGSLIGWGLVLPPEDATEIEDNCWYRILSDEEKTAVFLGIDSDWDLWEEPFVVPANIKFPDHGDTEYKVTEIGNDAFTLEIPRNPMFGFWEVDYEGGCEFCMVASATLPETVTKIGDRVFAGARTGFAEFRFPDEVTEIGENCFYWSDGIERLFLPATLKNIPARFAGLCKNLKECEIPSATERIGAQAFFRCNSMERVFIPASVKEIESDAFTALISIENFEVDPANENYMAPDGILLDKEGKTLIAWPFKRTDVVVPEGVETIQGEALNYAFELFKSIDLPSSLRTLPYYSFSCDTDIRKLTVRADVPPVCEERAEDPFFAPKVYDNATLYVPAGSVEAYRQTPVWGKFKNIRAIGSDAVEGVSADPDTTESEYFTLDGRKTGSPAEGEIVIRRQNGRSTTIIR